MKSDSSALYFGSSEKFLSCCDFTIYNSWFRKQIKQRYREQQKQRNKYSVWGFLVNVDQKKSQKSKNFYWVCLFWYGKFYWEATAERQKQRLYILKVKTSCWLLICTGHRGMYHLFLEPFFYLKITRFEVLTCFTLLLRVRSFIVTFLQNAFFSIPLTING